MDVKRPRKRGSSVAVIDIGSNSVRLVVYEGLTRSLIPIFNEKTLCGLGREVQSTGLLAPDACLLYTSPSPRDGLLSRMPSSA